MTDRTPGPASHTFFSQRLRLHYVDWGNAGKSFIVSSHILHEVDVISDQVILLSNGYVVAEGQIKGVRDEMREHPMQVLIRCNRPGDPHRRCKGYLSGMGMGLCGSAKDSRCPLRSVPDIFR